MRESRLARGWTLEQTEEYIRKSNPDGLTVTLKNISVMERALCVPSWNNFCLLAEAQYLERDGKILTLSELMDIVSQMPDTSHETKCLQSLLLSYCNNNDLTIDDLMKIYGEHLDVRKLYSGDFDRISNKMYLVQFLCMILHNPDTGKLFRYPDVLLAYCKNKGRS